jgi:hypothetical protein
MDASTPDSSGGCPSGITQSGQTVMPLRGLATTDLQTDVCPAGEAIIGYFGSTSNRWVETLEVLCGKVTFFSTGFTCQVAILPATMMPIRGNSTPSASWFLRCPNNQVMAVSNAWSGGRLDALGIECAPLVLTPSGMGFQLSVGALTTVMPQGGPGGTQFRDPCPAGMIAVGNNTSYNGLISTYQLVCATPTLVP